MFSTQSGHFVKASFDFAPQKGPYPLVKLKDPVTQLFGTYHLVSFISINLFNIPFTYRLFIAL